MLFIGVVSKAYAQCDLGMSNFKIGSNVRVETPDPNFTSNKKFTIDIEFDLKYNSTDKKVYLHFFKADEYNNFFNCDNPQPPTAQNLGNTAMYEEGTSIIDLALDNSVARGATGEVVSVNLLPAYGPDPSVIITSEANAPDIEVTKTYTGSNNTDHFVIKNLVVYINNYVAGAFALQNLLWSSTENSNTVNCAACSPPVYANDPELHGTNTCKQFSFTLTSNNPDVQTVTYKAYIDYDEDGAIDAEEPLVKSSTATFSSASPYASGTQFYTNNSGVIKPLLILIEGPTLAASLIQSTEFDPGEACSILPVQFKSFSASRNKQKGEEVQLKWETAMEQNNTGFQVQRKTTGDWLNIAFIASKAPGGNTNSELAYEYVDINTNKGVSQYRLLQVDIDSKSSFSDVKSVEGSEKGKSVLIYPNPGINGKVNLVFSNQGSIKDVVVSDLAGRVVKYYQQVAHSNLTIEGLANGLYSIKIIDRSTSTIYVEKVVIK
jgi:hypothetical protein